MTQFRNISFILTSVIVLETFAYFEHVYHEYFLATAGFEFSRFTLMRFFKYKRNHSEMKCYRCIFEKASKAVDIKISIKIMI